MKPPPKITPTPPLCPPLCRLVAVIGCDGSGKSTLTADLVARLSDTHPIECIYLGQSSGNIADRLSSLPVIGPPIERYLLRRASRVHNSASKSPDTGAAIVMFLLSLWRAYKFRRMLKLHRRGAFIITDRYPQAEVPGFYFDGTGLDATTAKGWLIRTLAAGELRLYQRMAKHVPALVIRLNIDAQTAHARKPDHKISMLRSKTEIIPTLHFNHARLLDLDSRDPYAHVLDTALKAVKQTFSTAAD